MATAVEVPEDFEWFAMDTAPYQKKVLRSTAIQYPIDPSLSGDIGVTAIPHDYVNVRGNTPIITLIYGTMGECSHTRHNWCVLVYDEHPCIYNVHMNWEDELVKFGSMLRDSQPTKNQRGLTVEQVQLAYTPLSELKSYRHITANDEKRRARYKNYITERRRRMQKQLKRKRKLGETK